MKDAERLELNAIIVNVNRIVAELETVGGIIRSSFLGIGSEDCAYAVMRVSEKCQHVMTRLQKID